MDFRKGEIIAIDKPYRMSSFGALAHVRYLLSKNIIIGDALNYHRVDRPDEWIVISEWSLLGSGMMNRRDYTFSYLVATSHGNDLFSDVPCDTFEPVYFLNLNPVSYGE